MSLHVISPSRSAGISNSGAVVSVIVMIWSHVDVLPQASVAVHVLVKVFTHPSPDKPPSANVTVASPQSSVAVAMPVAEGLLSAVQSTVASAGQVITGAVLSIRFRLVETGSDVLPQSSAATNVQISVAMSQSSPNVTSIEISSQSLPLQSSVVPNGINPLLTNNALAASRNASSSASVNVPFAKPVTSSKLISLHVISPSRSAGISNSGAVVSVIVMIWSHVDVLPQASVAVHVLVKVFTHPSPDKPPSTNVTVASPQSSVAVAMPVAEGLLSAVQSTVASAGHAITGAVLSIMLRIVAVDSDALPQSSTATKMQLRVAKAAQSSLTTTSIAISSQSLPLQSSVVPNGINPLSINN